jgi:hypothetical protein
VLGKEVHKHWNANYNKSLKNIISDKYLLFCPISNQYNRISIEVEQILSERNWQEIV